MEIRKAKETDLSDIMEIYAHARNYMKEHGNPNQWYLRNWPPEFLICADIQKQKCYVCIEDEQVLGVFYYDYGYKIDATYHTIDGKWIGTETYGVVHRIASGGAKKGIGTFCIKWALEQCGHLRIDTHKDNRTMQNLLLKLGFQECGIIYIEEDHAPRLAYEIQK